MGFLNIQGKKVHYMDLNPQGKNTIVMIHGMFTGLSMYFYTIAPKLAKYHRVILYDLRSHGLSERRDEGYTLEIVSNDFLMLLEALKIDRADVVGYSFGGAIALFTALQHPEKVKRLALIEATLMSETIDGHLLSEGTSVQNLQQGLAKYRNSVRFKISDAQLEKAMERNRFLVENDLLPAAFRSGSEVLRQAPMEHCTLPVLLLYGNHSDYRTSGDTLKERLAGSKLYVGRGDHNLPVQQSRWVSHKLINFFK